MRTSRPFVSVVVPTRDRPEFVAYCLQSLLGQDFTDFEVIVSDNATTRPCGDVFGQFSDERFRYVSPPSPLAMHDNWEYGCEQAAGEHVAVVIDKTALRPSALRRMYDTLETHPADVVTWWNDTYVPIDAPASYGRGVFTPHFTPVRPAYFDARDDLSRRYRMDVRRGHDGIRYYRGKIPYGAYSRGLISRIRGAVGRLFYPISPDYTSMIAALALAKGPLDLGEPLVMSFDTRIGGYRLARQPEVAARFLEQIDPALDMVTNLPLAGLHTSTHNRVAHDYATMRERIGGPLSELSVDLANLLVRAREDLDTEVEWPDRELKKEQYGIWRSHYRKLSIASRVAIQRELVAGRRRRQISRWKGWAADRVGWLQPTYRKVTGRRNPPPRPGFQCDSILDALQHADAYYASDAQQAGNAAP